MLALAPTEVAILLATVLPAVSEILWKAEALAMLVDCHTFDSKLATGPVLQGPTGTHARHTLVPDIAGAYMSGTSSLACIGRLVKFEVSVGCVP